ncbi:MAG TPA: sigma-70 family RNA polymerase sigma factor [Bryobacteraceae bacterium]|jgi:RNA polymerase sigma factor (TIGR02999 family)
MVRQSRDEITRLLTGWTSGRQEPAPELWAVVYRELRQIARAYMRKERPDHTLRTTALVNEAYLRVFQGKAFRWESRKHFFCAMAQAMRRVLVDHARECHAEKRGGDWEKLPIEAALPLSNAHPEELIALDEALEELGRLSPRQAEVVEMRFFVGLTVEETAAMLQISPETVKLDWRFAKAWLQGKMRTEGTAHDGA